jgi:hypothetical protein
MDASRIAAIDRRGACRRGGRSDFTLASAFFGVTIVALWIGVAYWRAMGIL